MSLAFSFNQIKTQGTFLTKEENNANETKVNHKLSNRIQIIQDKY